MSDEKSPEPKERPILFSAPMVVAILEGRKTQTRRIVKTQPGAEVVTIDYWLGDTAAGIDSGDASAWQGRCPYGKPGDRLWVRETWMPLAAGERKHLYRATDAVRVVEGTPPKWRPSIHMPRAASRITLEVAELRVERLQQIDEEDARAEGVSAHNDDGSCTCGEKLYHTEGQIYTRRSAVEAYRDLWERINGKGAWGKNPCVWVVSFKRLEVSRGQ